MHMHGEFLPSLTLPPLLPCLPEETGHVLQDRWDGLGLEVEGGLHTGWGTGPSPLSPHYLRVEPFSPLSLLYLTTHPIMGRQTFLPTYYLLLPASFLPFLLPAFLYTGGRA